MRRRNLAPAMNNAEIALHFDELGDLYELDGAIVHRVVAYHNAAKAIRESTQPVAELARQGRATELAGVGKTIAEKIDVLLETGKIPSAEKLKAKYPPGLIEVTRIPGLGPKRARKLFDELGVASLEDLKAAAESDAIRDLKGFGAKAQDNVLTALAAGEDGRAKPRILLSKALEIAESLIGVLREHDASNHVELAGSARRWGETSKDLDIVATASDPLALATFFSTMPLIGECSTPTAAGARAVTHNGVPVDLRIVPPEAYGNLLQHFTGSKQHNEALRTDAVKRGLHVSEYGITGDKDGVTRTCATEEEVYELLGMQYIPPELRENRGELKAARAHELPELIEVADIKGELHCHTTASDGRQTIEEMARQALANGYEYIAITDHSATHGFGNDVSPEALVEHMAAVRRVNEEIDGITVLAGTEVNILTDGAPDYADELLAQLDWVVGSLHTSFRLSEKEQTERMIAAMKHPLIDVIGHPTGRLIERRNPYPLDIDRVIEAAVETGTFLEINASPHRRDLNEINARKAVEAGVRITIDSDAHGIETLANIRYGVATARRAWMTKENVVNTRPWAEVKAMTKRARSA
jgi:DNA polymerase (family 10)